MKKHIAVVTTVGLLFMGSMAAQAANVHLVEGITVTDDGSSAKACGKLAGLGNADIIITLTGTATVTTSCVNPAGKVAPGHAEKVVTGTIRIRSTEVKNGSVTFCVRTEDPACGSAKECGCPNNNWSATIKDVEFHTLTLTVEQRGKVVLEETVLE